HPMSVHLSRCEVRSEAVYARRAVASDRCRDAFGCGVGVETQRLWLDDTAETHRHRDVFELPGLHAHEGIRALREARHRHEQRTGQLTLTRLLTVRPPVARKLAGHHPAYLVGRDVRQHRAGNPYAA